MKKSLGVVVALLIGLAGCTPAAEMSPTPGTTEPASSASPSPSVTPLGTRYELPADRDAARWGEPLASKTGKRPSDPKLNKSREGWRVDLMGVYRLAEDRVLAEFRLNADNAARPDMMVWEDPNYTSWFHNSDLKNDGYAGAVWEFSDVRLKVAGDDASYRAVRTKSSFCLCSMSLDRPKGYGDYPAYVVMSTPKDASVVSLSLPDVGTFEDIAVSSQAPERSVVPIGFGYQLRLQALTRPTEGTVRVRFSLETPGDGVEGTEFRSRATYQFGASPWQGLSDFGAEYQNLIVTDSGGQLGGWPKRSSQGECESCTKVAKNLSEPGQAVDLEIDLPDPGGEGVVVAPMAGWPFSVAGVDGTGSTSADSVEYRRQQVVTGGTIGKDYVSLDSAVLFDVDKATLTKKAKKALDSAAKALQDQEKRNVLIVGHTDSTGSAAHNLDLSKRRARAVQTALAQRLGSGWTFTVQGKGESDPTVKEDGLSGAKLARARAANRRVEVTAK